ncbi:hypothetical protein CEXT_315551 [Caerostris extrusa]|uniref:Uncharacterized protein n=1 Tax=Caerostris extrusa TaxID=172846 RepID=A0AAV4QRC1_CAEEX|nr:hypothetical protein CEXT_315551 [Caerostris extrusa]
MEIISSHLFFFLEHEKGLRLCSIVNHLAKRICLAGEITSSRSKSSRQEVSVENIWWKKRCSSICLSAGRCTLSRVRWMVHLPLFCTRDKYLIDENL